MNIWIKAACTPIVVALLAVGTNTWADSVAVNFGSEEPVEIPGGTEVNGPAGVLGTAVWNNTIGIADTANGLFADSGGSAVSTGVSITWSANNTWASQGKGEENNTAPEGDDRNLMSGYLDTTDVSVTTIDVAGLSSFFTDPVTVYVYMHGGVNGRGGDYEIAGTVKPNVVSGAFDGTYAPGATGNYLIFPNIAGDAFTLTATPTTGSPFRAPINGIEIVGVGSVGLAGDVNEDGVVDLDDFAIIRDNFLTGTLRAEGDLNFDQIVNFRDFRLWKDNFDGAGGAMSVPEPAGWLLILVGLAGGLYGLRRRSSQRRLIGAAD